MPLSFKEKLLIGAGVAGLCWGAYKFYCYIRRANGGDDDDDDAANVLSSTPPPPPPPPSSDLPVPPAFTPPPAWVFQQPYRHFLPREVLLGQLEELEFQAIEEERENQRHRCPRGDEAGPSGGGGY